MDAQGVVNAAYDPATNRLRLTFAATTPSGDDEGEELNGLVSRLLVNGELQVMRV